MAGSTYLTYDAGGAIKRVGSIHPSLMDSLVTPDGETLVVVTTADEIAAAQNPGAYSYNPAGGEGGGGGFEQN